jgi:hypothetical protein
MPNKAPAKIKWPVDEMGKNSVKPSTMPITAALSIKTVSTNAPENSHGLSLLAHAITSVRTAALQLTPQPCRFVASSFSMR